MSDHTPLPWTQRCIACGASFAPRDVRYRCDCGDILEIHHTFEPTQRPLRSLWDERLASRATIDRSGVWRFRELVLPLPVSSIVSKPEGRVNLYAHDRLRAFTGVDDLHLRHEGENPTGSFKDRGMTAGVSMARHLGMRAVACASTGNTSASLASYAAQAGMAAFVFLPDGKISSGKLAQTLAYGAHTIQIAGNFDDAMRRVEEVCNTLGIYLLNSINPYRIEGQKAIGLDLVQELDWTPPDWIVVPGGNLGNNTAIWKGLKEAHDLGVIRKLPRIAVVQAAGAAPLAAHFASGEPWSPWLAPETLATAIRIGSPVSWKKSLAAVRDSDGVVTSVTDAEILEAKSIVDASGVGAEPASCASVAGLKQLRNSGVIRPGDSVVCILTGHVLKDPDTVAAWHDDNIPKIPNPCPNRPVRFDNDAAAIAAHLERWLELRHPN